MTLLRRTPASFTKSECAGCRQQGQAGSKTLQQQLQNSPFANRRCRLTQVDLYNEYLYFALHDSTIKHTVLQ